MTWESFGLRRADEQTRRGFRLIGRIVHRRRQSLGISQRQLEALCGVDQTVISRLENGRLASLRWSRFASLVAALGGLGETPVVPDWHARSLPPRGDEHRADEEH
jgi:transcriptional regulator with XRE-family HTH domain